MMQWEVKKFYRAFGLDLNEEAREVPDHIVNELEFMHFLAHLAVAAGRGRLGGSVDRRQYVHAQKDFLERHLGQWTARFCEALQEKGKVRGNQGERSRSAGFWRFGKP